MRSNLITIRILCQRETHRKHYAFHKYIISWLVFMLNVSNTKHMKQWYAGQQLENPKPKPTKHNLLSAI